jgi:hypothetical protein
VIYGARAISDFNVALRSLDSIDLVALEQVRERSEKFV